MKLSLVSSYTFRRTQAFWLLWRLSEGHMIARFLSEHSLFFWKKGLLHWEIKDSHSAFDSSRGLMMLKRIQMRIMSCELQTTNYRIQIPGTNTVQIKSLYRSSEGIKCINLHYRSLRIMICFVGNSDLSQWSECLSDVLQKTKAFYRQKHCILLK